MMINQRMIVFRHKVITKYLEVLNQKHLQAHQTEVTRQCQVMMILVELVI